MALFFGEQSTNTFGEAELLVDIQVSPLVSEVVYPTLTLEGSLSIPPIECDVVFDTITLPDTVVIPPIYVDAIYPTISLNGERIYDSNNLVVF
jgi:hypothetical protein